MDQQRIGACIKKIRQGQHLSQQQFAQRYHVSYQAVSKWEHGRNMPDIAILRQICKDYELDLEKLLDGELSQYNKKPSRFLSVAAAFCMILLLIGVWTLKRPTPTYAFKTITASCDNFDLYGSMAYNDNSSSIYITHITYCGENHNTMYERISCILYEERGDNKHPISEYTYADTAKAITLDEFLKDVEFRIDHEEQSCANEEGHTLYLEIHGVTTEHNREDYQIPLSLADAC